MFLMLTLLATEFTHFKFNEDTFNYLKSLKSQKDRYIFGGLYDIIEEHTTNRNVFKELDENEKVSEFTWEEIFDDFTISISRNIVPSVSSNDYLVYDTFIINVDAQIYLQKLAELGIVNITNIALGAFRGIFFKREYTYVQTVPTYSEGVTAPLHKVISSFNIFHAQRLELIEPNESVYFSQYFDSTNRLSVKIPLHKFVRTGIDFDIEKNVLSSISIYPGQKDEVLRVHVNKLGNFNTNFSASLNLDFYRVLSLTLFSFTNNTSKMEKEEIDLAIYAKDLEDIKNRQGIFTSLRGLFRFDSIDTNSIKNNIISLVNRYKEDSSTKVSILNLLNSKRETLEKEIKITPQGESLFYRLNYNSGQLTNIPLAILNFYGKDFITSNFVDYMGVRKLTNHGFVIEQLDGAVSLIRVTYTYFAANFNANDLEIVNNLVTGNPVIVEGQPLYIESNFILSENAINHLTSLDYETIEVLMNNFCSNYFDATKSINYYATGKAYCLADGLSIYQRVKRGPDSLRNWGHFLKFLAQYNATMKDYSYFLGPVFNYGRVNQVINRMSSYFVFDNQLGEKALILK